MAREFLSSVHGEFGEQNFEGAQPLLSHCSAIGVNHHFWLVSESILQINFPKTTEEFTRSYVIASRWVKKPDARTKKCNKSAETKHRREKTMAHRAQTNRHFVCENLLGNADALDASAIINAKAINQFSVKRICIHFHTSAFCASNCISCVTPFAHP